MCKIEPNLIGIVVSSLVICISLVVSYVNTDNEVKWPCEQAPVTSVEKIAEVQRRVTKAVSESQSRVLLFADGVHAEYFIESLEIAIERQIPVSVIMPHSDAAVAKLTAIGVTNVTCGVNVSCGFVVVDNAAFVFSGVFAEDINRLAVLNNITECETAVSDIVNFFNYQYLRLRNEIPTIVPIAMHAKTSLIKPLVIGDTSETMYFFHNPFSMGDPIRRATSDLLAQSLYINVNEEPKANVSVLCDDVPEPNQDEELTFFTVLKRVLIKVSKELDKNESTLHLRLLVPEKYEKTEKSRWLNSTAAFRNAEVRLFEDKWQGPNFVEVGDRVFVFSHTLNDADFGNKLGFHMSTNCSDIVEVMMSYWDQVWDDSKPYLFTPA